MTYSGYFLWGRYVSSYDKLHELQIVLLTDTEFTSPIIQFGYETFHFVSICFLNMVLINIYGLFIEQ